jgi:hypothetical protein
VRHAVAKAVQRELEWTGGKLFISTSNIVTGLLNACSSAGAAGGFVHDLNGKSFRVQGRGGHIYMFELHITMVDNPQKSHVVCVDLRFALPEKYGQFKAEQGHAMFCEMHDPQRQEIICRNSWGSKLMHIRIPYRPDYKLYLYKVTVKNLIWLSNTRKAKDIGICVNFQHFDQEKWPKQD